jgi:alcohol dehydrogenase
LGEQAAAIGKRALLVSYADHEVLRDVLERALAQLAEHGVDAPVFFEVEPNPEIEMVARGVQAAKTAGAELVIGIGGGSVMDTAKVIAAGVQYDGAICGTWSTAATMKSGSCRLGRLCRR